MNQTKTCSKCGGEFPATTEYWHRNKSRKDGLRCACKVCVCATSALSRQRLITDPVTGEVVKAGVLALRKLVTDPVTGEVVKAGLLANRKYRSTEEGHEKANASARKARQRLITDPATGKAISAGTLASRKNRSTEEGREKANTATRLAHQKRKENGKYQEYLNSNPLYKLRKRLSNLLNCAMRNKGWSKTTKTHALLGCSFQEFKAHIESQFKDGMSWENAGEWHYDHVLCCNCAENEDELNALQHWSNFQPLWGSDNARKSDSLPPDWKERKAKLMALYWSRFPERRAAA